MPMILMKALFTASRRTIAITTAMMQLKTCFIMANIHMLDSGFLREVLWIWPDIFRAIYWPSTFMFHRSPATSFVLLFPTLDTKLPASEFSLHHFY